MSSHNYINSTNPFDNDEEVADETFLKNSRRSQSGASNSSNIQVQSFLERRRQIEENTIQSSEQSLRILHDSEQIGIATAEELARQREKLEKTDKNLDDINSTLISSQKHINGIKSVFSSLKNYMSGRSDRNHTCTTTASSSLKTVESSSNTNRKFGDAVQSYDRCQVNPGTQLRSNQYTQSSSQTLKTTSSDYNSRLDQNLHEMCGKITSLKELAAHLGEEIDSQNELLDRITDKTDQADLRVQQQNKQMSKILKK